MPTGQKDPLLLYYLPLGLARGPGGLSRRPSQHFGVLGVSQGDENSPAARSWASPFQNSTNTVPCHRITATAAAEIKGA